MSEKDRKTRKPRSLVTKQIERVSKELFRMHFELITDLVGNSPGIYALYDESDLYYVGKSIDLKRRVKQHLRDRHYSSWTHFSLYLVRKSEHIHEIESLLIRISNPVGNKKIPKGKSSGPLLKKLKVMVKAKQKEEFKQIFGGKKSAKKNIKGRKSLEGAVSRRTALYRTYKGKEYKAFLNKSGTISYAGKTYQSPTAAAKVAQKRTAGVNGLSFWYIKDSNGYWIKLGQFISN